jgi:hypothetical protein
LKETVSRMWEKWPRGTTIARLTPECEKIFMSYSTTDKGLIYKELKN